MKTLSNIIKPLALGLFIILSGPQAFAEDIEVYLVNQETEGANILILIDNAASAHSVYADGTAPGGTKYFDEIAYAMKNVVNSVTNAARIGVSSQHAGGTKGGFINYPVRDLTVGSEDPLQFSVLGSEDEASQATVKSVTGPLDVKDATISFPTTFKGATWDIDDPADNERLGIIFSNVDIPTYAKITSADLVLGVVSNTAGNGKYDVGVSIETTITPASFGATDIQSRSYTTPIVVTAYLNGNELRIPGLQGLIQRAVNVAGWCPGSISLLIDGANIPDGDDIQITTRRNTGSSLPGNSLEILWDPTDDSEVPPGGLSCSGPQAHTLAETSDDATENVNKGTLLDLSGTELRIYEKTKGNPDSIGVYAAALRFAALPYGPSDVDTTIKSAELNFEISASSGGNVNIGVVRGDTPAFVNDGDIKALLDELLINKNYISVPATVGAQTVSVTTLVYEAMQSLRGWAAQDTLGFVIWLDSAKDVTIHATEGGAGSPASLVIEVEASSPGAFAPSRRAEVRAAIDAMAASNGGGNAKPHNTYVESARYMLGIAPKFEAGLSHPDTVTNPGGGRTPYIEPNIPGECGANHIVLLNHSEAPNEDPIASTKEVMDPLGLGSACSSTAEVEVEVDTDGDGIPDSTSMMPVGQRWACSGELAAWLKDADTNPLGVPVTTHAIAFAPNKDETLYGMQYVAEQGGGQFLEAKNADELAAALKQIINDVTISNASLAAPGVAVNQLNRFRHLDQLFYGVFAPAVTNRWEGNLKRYRLAPGPEIVDENNDPAVDLDSGFFKEDADSWWGSEPDGPTVVKGGAREELLDRQLYVADTTPAPGSDTANSKPGSDKVVPYTLATDFNTIDETRFGFNATERSEFTAAFERIMLTGWGDPLHSEPRLANFGFKGASLELAAADPNLQKNLVFVATNDGTIHAIDPIDGSERWAFVPAEEALKLKARTSKANLVNQSRNTYGMDGGMTFWRRGNGSTGVEHLLLYAAQRRGGRNYYGLDVTDAYTSGAPGLMWVIQGGSNGFKKLGQSWSSPILAQVKVNNVATPVLIFNGGYDPTTHDVEGAVNTSGDSVGNAIYIVNAWSGGLIWSASNNLADGAKMANADMKWSLPASPAVVDRDFDGFVDHIYSADTAGQIFRVDINNANTGAADLAFRVKTFAQLGITESSTDIDSVVNNRKFFAQPVVGSNDRGNGYILQIGLGSGNRVYPTNMDTDDRIFLLDDDEAINALQSTLTPSPVLTSADLLDVTNEADATSFDPAVHKGWYVDLLDNGEKSVSSGAIVDGKLIMTAYLPDTAIRDCTRVIGLSRLYTFDVLNGAAPPDTPRSKDVQLPGLSPNVNVTVNANDNGTSDLTVIVGTQVEYGGEADAGRLSKTRWYEVESKTQADQIINDAKAAAP